MLIGQPGSKTSQQPQGALEIDFVLDKDTEVDHFVDIIRAMYKQELITPPEDLLAVLKLADKYEVDSFIILHKFKRIRDLFKSEEFLRLPMEAVLVLVKSDELIVDSENSVLYFIMTWILKEPETRESCFILFLPYIRFPQMLKYFLLDVVPHVATHFKDPQIKPKILEARSLALESHVGGSRRIVRNRMLNPDDTSHLFVPRATLPDPLRFPIKCIFKEVSRWDLYGRYYSDPVFAHGYEFYFFLRKQIITPPKNPETNGEIPNPEDFTLAGFLKCTSRLIPLKHFLPICSSVSILLRGNQERKFTPSRIVFEASEKAIGGELTIPDENWSTIVSGESVLVVDNTLTVLVTVEFLNSDHLCGHFSAKKRWSP